MEEPGLQPGEEEGPRGPQGGAGLEQEGGGGGPQRSTKGRIWPRARRGRMRALDVHKKRFSISCICDLFVFLGKGMIFQKH